MRNDRMPDDKDLNFDALRAVAKAALAEADNDPLDWYDEELLERFLIVDETKARGPFIATFNPAVVLRLLDLAQREYERGKGK